jgi:hypothetical protein
LRLQHVGRCDVQWDQDEGDATTQGIPRFTGGGILRGRELD